MWACAQKSLNLWAEARGKGRRRDDYFIMSVGTGVTYTYIGDFNCEGERLKVIGALIVIYSYEAITLNYRR